MLTENEKEIMVSILRTMIYNNFNDLKKIYIEEKNNLSKEALNLLLFGDKDLLESISQYKVISQLENRWCLKSLLYYNLTKTYKISKDDYNGFFCL